jgi:putative ATP-dependent endonuclease of OLD family
MEILELTITNYRAYSEDGQTVQFKPGINIIVGENNIGKSAILKAIEFLTRAETESVAAKDFYKNETQREISIKALFRLSQREMEILFGDQVVRYPSNKMDELRNLFGVIGFSYSSKDGFSLNFGNIHCFGSIVTIEAKRPKLVRGSLTWKELLDKYFSNKELVPFSQVIKTLMEELKSTAFSLDVNLTEKFRNLLRNKFHIFAEIRQNPHGENIDVLESYDGRYVADVLFKLKNGSLQERRRWRIIKKSFRDFFPTLELEVRKDRNNPPEISIEKPSIGFEIPIENVGAGIGEIIILVTHLIASRENIFGLEMPELHFHPHLQRLLRKFLDEHSLENQFVVTTHSPFFINENDIENLILVKDIRGVVSILTMPQNFLSPRDKFRIARQLDANTKELFFARKILLVEGETELGAFPIFAKYLEKDFDLQGISVVKSGKHFALFARLLKLYKTPFLVVVDRDALMEIFKTVKIDDVKGRANVKTSAIFYNLWKADLIKKKDLNFLAKIEPQITNGRYPENVFDQLKKISLGYNVYVLSSDFENVLKSDVNIRAIFDQAKKFSDSKVVMGRFIAEKIMRNQLKLPKEFSEIMDMLSKINK